ncbi:TetR/AcrR family transcriptional regulator [Homoserinimonas sp. OAct 916]|uniref:TetR/AcrR family transcriptional regulator n=1 Tax=Homoserinimonas sp. OAct 916 TaxID=2211450 RepID=UPI000DBE401D|nr:TetR-like C-terminal domain-containing protein [Homoserinimonas sp. OAct 916]
MARAALNGETVIAEAARLVDALGPTSLTLAVLADSLGVKIPSIYKHVDGMPGLQRGIMLNAKRELAHALRRAAVGASRDDAIEAICVTYRKWALAHPGQYPAVVHAPVPGDDADEQVSRELIEILFKVLAGYDLHEDVAVDAARYFRSAIHGFVSLETSGGFELPNDLDRSFARIIDNLAAAFAAWSCT